MDRGRFRLRGSERMKKGIYFLPNLLTSASLFCGFYSIVSTFNGDFHRAAVAILFATFFDSIDGSVERLTRTTSQFGVEYDSLSDLVSFGVAPAILVYGWALSSWGKWGWAVSFLFVACAALRLARYNVQISTLEKRVFNGLPSPAAACMVATTILLYVNPIEDVEEKRRLVKPITNLIAKPLDYFIERPMEFLLSKQITLLLLVLGLALLMISTVKYRSFKEMELFRKKPFRVLFLSVVFLILIAAEPEKMLFALMAVYVLSGIVEGIIFYRKRKLEKAQALKPA